MTYEQLDAIADAYIPLLGILVLTLLTKHLYYRDFKKAKTLGLSTLFCVASVYLIMAADNALSIWPQLSWDYSTHTALSLALVMLLIAEPKTKTLTRNISVCLSFLAYALLMLYQKYHTIADILSTAIVIGIVCFGILKYMYSDNSNTEAPKTSAP